MEMSRAQVILDTILSIQPKEGGNSRGGESRESVVYRLAEDMLEKMPKDYIDHEVKLENKQIGLNPYDPYNPYFFFKMELMRCMFLILSFHQGGF